MCVLAAHDAPTARRHTGCGRCTSFRAQSTALERYLVDDYGPGGIALCAKQNEAATHPPCAQHQCVGAFIGFDDVITVCSFDLSPLSLLAGAVLLIGCAKGRSALGVVQVLVVLEAAAMLSKAAVFTVKSIEAHSMPSSEEKSALM